MITPPFSQEFPPVWRLTERGTFTSSSYAIRIASLLFWKEENTVPMMEEKRIAAGINWAKTMMIPKVRKKHPPKSPIPLIPPA
jgi:hypothetical protein